MKSSELNDQLDHFQAILGSIITHFKRATYIFREEDEDEVRHFLKTIDRAIKNLKDVIETATGPVDVNSLDAPQVAPAGKIKTEQDTDFDSTLDVEPVHDVTRASNSTATKETAGLDRTGGGGDGNYDDDTDSQGTEDLDIKPEPQDLDIDDINFEDEDFDDDMMKEIDAAEKSYNDAPEEEFKMEEEDVDCEKCAKGFPTRQSLLQHIKRGHDKRYSCRVCDQGFQSFYARKAHEDSHTESSERPYVCQVCNNSYKHKKDLKEHHFIHTNTPQVCYNCNRSYKHSRSLRKHQESCVQGKSWPCEHCNYVAKNASNLQRHKHTKHKDVIKQSTKTPKPSPAKTCDTEPVPQQMPVVQTSNTDPQQYQAPLLPNNDESQQYQDFFTNSVLNEDQPGPVLDGFQGY